MRAESLPYSCGEENPVNARVARLLLERLGYASDWAVNGRKAVDSFAQQNYDLVLMLECTILSASRCNWKNSLPDWSELIAELPPETLTSKRRGRTVTVNGASCREQDSRIVAASL